MADASEIRLVYFDIRGFAEPIRWMFQLAGKAFVDERIPLDAWATQRKRSSNEDRKEFKRKSMDNSQTVQRFKAFIGQLPILYHGDITLTQTLAVIRFIARRYGFNGDSQWEEARADEISDLVYDLRLCAVDYLNNGFKSATPDIVRHTVFRDFNREPESPAKEKMRDELRTIHLPLYFNKFRDLLIQAGGKYIAGPNLTYGDLVLVNFLDIVEELVDPNCLDEFPNLKDLKDRVFALPEIAEWRAAQKADALESGYPEGG